MAFCKNCSNELTEGARFCSMCGAPVEESADVSAVDTVQTSSADEVTSESVIAEPVIAEPVVAEPVVAEAVVAEPVVAEPVVAEPVVAEPVVAEPADSNPFAAVVEEPSVVSEPTTDSNQSENPFVSAPSLAQPEVSAQTDEPAVEPAPVAAPVPAVPVAVDTSSAQASTKESEQAFLDGIYAHLKHERLCWKICGFVWLGYAALFTILSFIIPVYWLITALYVVIMVICFVMIGKVDNYMNTLYTDCTAAIERCGSVGMIVFGAFFNTIAMIFIIINFASVKSHRAEIEAIKRNQAAYNSTVSH